MNGTISGKTKDIRDAINKIKKIFSIKEELIKDVSNVALLIQSENSISIHIRRGDYTNAAMLEYHGVQGIEYYNQAISFIKEKIQYEAEGLNLVRKSTEKLPL